MQPFVTNPFQRLSGAYNNQLDFHNALTGLFGGVSNASDSDPMMQDREAARFALHGTDPNYTPSIPISGQNLQQMQQLKQRNDMAYQQASRPFSLPF